MSDDKKNANESKGAKPLKNNRKSGSDKPSRSAKQSYTDTPAKSDKKAAKTKPDNKKTHSQKSSPSTIVLSTQSGASDKSASDKNAPDKSAPDKPVSGDKAVSQNKAGNKQADTNQPAKNKRAKTESTTKAETKSKETTTGNLFNARPAPRLNTGKKSRKLNWLPVMAICLAIITLIAVIWTTYYQNEMQQGWGALQTSLDQQWNEQKQQTESTSNKAENSLQNARNNQNAINQQQQLIQQLQQTLTGMQARIRELSGRQQQDWMLAEAEYLIGLAEYKVLLEKDKNTAIALLKTADEKVLAIGDNTLIQLRKAIAQDISNLQLVVAPDINGIAAQIDAVIQQIPQLNIIAYELLVKAARRESQREQSSSENTDYSWDKFYNRFLQDFVIIKDHSQPVKPLMTPEQRSNLNANIQLALQQAQIGLMRAQQPIYDRNLDNAAKWIKEFYKNDDTSQAIIKQLKTIRQVRVNIDMPEQLSAKKQIQQINQQRLYQWLEKSNTGKTPINNLPLPEKK